MSELPTGTVTFLFTDIEASTRLLQHLGDLGYAQALVEHRRLLRAAFVAAGGRELETQGDGFLVAFQRATDAAHAAVAGQKVLHAHPWPQGGTIRVRMALHSGEPVGTAEGYVGLGLHKVQRICTAGYGGQILLSETARSLIEDMVPAGLGLRDLGAHRLKDLQRPERIYQLLHPDLPVDFPPLRSLDSLPNNLPHQLTSFVGREREMTEVNRLLSTTRLLTLTGSGGCGKTRLAIQVGADLVDTFEDGVWLVELAALVDHARVPQAVASAIGVREQPGRPLLATVSDYLQPRHLLLVLDNCEHLLAACAHLTYTLLSACPRVLILATSREPLGITGAETSWRVPSLSAPDPSHLPPLEQLPEFDAVRLFIDRATAALPTFRVTSQNAPFVAQTCHRLDGIPLAIELAAARVKVLSVEQIARRLDDLFHLLTGGSRTALLRQQTLRATMDWSHDLLSPKEKTLFRRLAVFAGGWILDAAETICAVSPLDHHQVFDLLSQLTDKSLVAVEDKGSEKRYRMLEIVRQYAREKLKEAGEDAETRRRHRDWFLDLAEQAEPRFRGADQTTWLNRLETEHDNLRAALDWSKTEGGGSDEQLRLAGALWRFWAVRGYFSEGRGWLEGALVRSGGPSVSVRAKALHAAGYLAFRLDDLRQAKALLEEALALHREVGDPASIAFSLGSLGSVAREQGDYEQAVAFLEEGLALARKLADKWALARAVGNLGVVEEFRGNYVRATRLFEESLAVSRDAGDRFGIAYALEHLGAVTVAQGQCQRARALLEEALTLFRELGDKAHIAYSHYELGIAAWLERDYGRAKQLLEQSLVLSREVGDRSRIARCLEGLAGVAVEEDQPDRAALLCGAVEVLREVIGTPLTPSGRVSHERNAEAARAALGEAAFEAAWAEGRTMTLEQAVEYALSGRA